MPKIISEDERQKTKYSIIESTKQLICTNNGMKNITVDDISSSVGIGKGSFYLYYKSKEECLYAVIKNWEAELFTQFETIMQEKRPQREKIEVFLRESYLSENSLNRYINPMDIEVLLRKLPSAFSESEKDKSDNYISSFMTSFGLNKVQMESLGALLDCVGCIFSNVTISKPAKEEAINTLVEAIVNYIEKNGVAEK